MRFRKKHHFKGRNKFLPVGILFSTVGLLLPPLAVTGWIILYYHFSIRAEFDRMRTEADQLPEAERAEVLQEIDEAEAQRRSGIELRIGAFWAVVALAGALGGGIWLSIREGLIWPAAAAVAIVAVFGFVFGIMRAHGVPLNGRKNKLSIKVEREDGEWRVERRAKVGGEWRTIDGTLQSPVVLPDIDRADKGVALGHAALR